MFPQRKHGNPPVRRNDGLTMCLLQRNTCVAESFGNSCPKASRPKRQGKTDEELVAIHRAFDAACVGFGGGASAVVSNAPPTLSTLLAVINYKYPKDEGSIELMSKTSHCVWLCVSHTLLLWINASCGITVGGEGDDAHSSQGGALVQRVVYDGEQQPNKPDCWPVKDQAKKRIEHRRELIRLFRQARTRMQTALSRAQTLGQAAGWITKGANDPPFSAEDVLTHHTVFSANCTMNEEEEFGRGGVAGTADLALQTGYSYAGINTERQRCEGYIFKYPSLRGEHAPEADCEPDLVIFDTQPGVMDECKDQFLIMASSKGGLGVLDVGDMGDDFPFQRQQLILPKDMHPDWLATLASSPVHLPPPLQVHPSIIKAGWNPLSDLPYFLADWTLSRQASAEFEAGAPQSARSSSGGAGSSSGGEAGGMSKRSESSAPSGGGKAKKMKQASSAEFDPPAEFEYPQLSSDLTQRVTQDRKTMIAELTKNGPVQGADAEEQEAWSKRRFQRGTDSFRNDYSVTTLRWIAQNCACLSVQAIEVRGKNKEEVIKIVMNACGKVVGSRP